MLKVRVALKINSLGDYGASKIKIFVGHTLYSRYLASATKRPSVTGKVLTTTGVHTRAQPNA